jgi:hypothetical protein
MLEKSSKHQLIRLGIGCFSLWVISFHSGCTTARYVMRNQEQGVIAIPANTNRWPSRNREKADSLMKEHFPSGYIVEHEEEFVVGQTTQYDEDRSGDVGLLGNRVVLSTGSRSGRATTTDQTEYRIYYRRN